VTRAEELKGALVAAFASNQPMLVEVCVVMA